MDTKTRSYVSALFVCWFAGTAQSQDPIQLPGRVVGGLVDADAKGTLLVTDDADRASKLVLLDGPEMRASIDLPPKRVGTSLRRLTGGRVLVGSQDATTMHDRVQHYDIVEIHGADLKKLWSWKSSDAFPGVDPGNHGFSVVFSGDGRAWGTGGGASFSFGETVTNSLAVRNERFEAGEELSDLRKWEDFVPPFLYLESAGPVVLSPWNKGAYIVHFSANGSPMVTPVLFDNGTEEYSFLWQWDERVLWAESSLYWKGYELLDLGLSGVAGEPTWVLEKSSGAPHPERGVVQLGSQDGAYRVEHAWRDPLTGVEERRASAWLREYQTPDASGRLRRRKPSVSPWASAVFVSADGGHAVVVEKRRFRGALASYAHALTLLPVPPVQPLEADRDAEVAADRERLGNVPW